MGTPRCNDERVTLRQVACFEGSQGRGLTCLQVERNAESGIEVILGLEHRSVGAQTRVH
jgi:hypothetical protein